MHCKSSIGRFSEFTLSRAFDEESVELSTGDRATARLDQGDGCPVNFGYVGNQHRTDFDRSEAQQIGGQVFSAFKGSIVAISCPPPMPRFETAANPDKTGCRRSFKWAVNLALRKRRSHVR